MISGIVGEYHMAKGFVGKVRCMTKCLCNEVYVMIISVQWKLILVEIPHDSHRQGVSGLMGIFSGCTVALVANAKRYIQQMWDAH